MNPKQEHTPPLASSMPKPDFFENQRHEIWTKAMVDEKRSNFLFPRRPRRKLAFAAVIIAFISTAGFALFSSQPEQCETFICLWEASDKTSLQVSEIELEQWLSEDEIFWAISESL